MKNWIINNVDFAEALAYWATAIGIVIALIAGIWAVWRHFEDRRLQRWSEARALYIEVIDISITYPELNGMFWKNVDPDDHAAIYRYEFQISETGII